MTEEKFQCKMCGKCFTHNWKLQRHHQRKTKCKKVEINYNIEHKVNILNKDLKETQKELEITKQDINILNDKLIHKKECYQCEFCNKTFTQSNNLSRHLRTCQYKIENISIYEKQLGIHVLILSQNPYHRKQQFDYKLYSMFQLLLLFFQIKIQVRIYLLSFESVGQHIPVYF